MKKKTIRARILLRRMKRTMTKILLPRGKGTKTLLRRRKRTKTLLRRRKRTRMLPCLRKRIRGDSTYPTTGELPTHTTRAVLDLGWLLAAHTLDEIFEAYQERHPRRVDDLSGSRWMRRWVVLVRR
jgi:hypothetical protein